MLRVKDIEKSLKFYQDILGMTLIRTHEAPSAGFNLYFLAYTGKGGLAEGTQQSQLEGILELTWNYGTEKQEDFKYHNGNDEPQGFGHICKSFLLWRVSQVTDNGVGVAVDNLEEACQRFEDLQCNWKKRLTEGRMKSVAFLLDPDGYWVEVIPNARLSGQDIS